MPTRIMKDLFTGEIKFIDEDDIPGRFGISFNRLRELVECNPHEGWAKWKVDRMCGKYSSVVATKAGDFLPDSPSHATVDGHRIYLYHIIWVFYTVGRWAVGEIDHKNGNRKNNKCINLRDVTPSQSIMNRSLAENNISGITGVYWDSYIRKWRAQLRKNKKVMLNRTFVNFEDALQARWDAEDKYFGEFARRHSRPRVPMKDLFSAQGAAP
jgi:hypothetical protein